ncbi:ribosome silencing factor [Adhaeribacter radiodurans]|uniref:Ribosomal silencing factor RsfS n=1 Tax=Adhaeribacter radiodurans TaxID=2745197 RepID=A0A7L7L4K5_9BACT|nr:ribosome silencing factor [Adhaeribacter radiodurans]QMU27742.1 ribosome silencing factor [Adhaeribacter radiodurans]
MIKKRIKEESDILTEVIIKGMQEKKASDIVVIDLKSMKNAVSDYFVISSANSDTQLDAVARSVEEEVFKALQQNPWQSEGRINKEWILLDYVDVVVHIFLKEKREFYALEELWGDAPIRYVETEAVKVV